MIPRILLMTDFGTRDGYPAAMKGVIWSIAPQAEVSDLTHEIPPQDVLSGALTLSCSVPYFPAGTLFVAVVDSGVGTARRPLAARLGELYFSAPDNGLLSLLLARAEQDSSPVEIVHLDRPQFWRQPLSRTFHGRDIFAPAAAHLANGVKLTELGTPISDPLRLRLPLPTPTPQGWAGEVIHVDAFGNLATNLGAGHMPAEGEVEIRIAGRRIAGLSQSYGEDPPGTLAALIDSTGALSIALVNGSAAEYLRAGIGAGVEIIVT